MGTLRQLFIQLLIAITTITTAPAFCGADLIYQADFEQPSFMPGLLPGQDEWFSLRDIGVAMITDVQPGAGAQSVQIDGAALEPDDRGGILVFTESAWPLNYDPVVNNFPIINIRADVRLDGPSTHPEDLISANLTARTVGNAIIASMFLSSNEQVLEAFGRLEAPVKLGQYNNLGLRLDFAQQETEFFLNENSLGVAPFNRIPDPELSSVGLELAAFNNPAKIDPGEYTAYFDNLIIYEGDVPPPQPGALRPGDADQDRKFDQLDLVQVQIAAKYLSGQTATWGEGDWDGAPGGSPGNPPAGDGVFNQLDIISALASGVYLTGPYGALAHNGSKNDEQASIVYVASSGEVRVDAPTAVELTSINIESVSGIFTGQPALNLGGSFDNDNDENIFKATFGGSFGSLSLGDVANPGLSEQFVRSDLSVVGSLQGGGVLGEVDLIYIPVPEPPTVALIGLAGATFVWAIRPRSSIRSLNSTFSYSQAPERSAGLGARFPHRSAFDKRSTL